MLGRATRRHLLSAQSGQFNLGTQWKPCARCGGGGSPALEAPIDVKPDHLLPTILLGAMQRHMGLGYMALVIVDPQALGVWSQSSSALCAQLCVHSSVCTALHSLKKLGLALTSGAYPELD